MTKKTPAKLERHLNGSAEKAVDDLTKKRIEELRPVVQHIIELMADAHLPVGDTTDDDMAKYRLLAGDVLELLLEKDIRYTDRIFLFQLILQPFDIMRDVVTKSLEESFNHAVDKSFGKTIDEFRLKDLDLILKQYQVDKPVDKVA